MEAIDKIQKFTSGVSYEEFLKDEILQEALVRKIEIIGEASKRLPENFKLLASNIPWNEITAMRNKIVHDYFEVDLEVVWSSIQNDLAPLKEFLEKNL